MHAAGVGRAVALGLVWSELIGCLGAELALPAELPHDGDPAIAMLLETVVRRYELPALAGALVTSDGLRSSGAVGFRKWGETAAVTVNDLWHLGSETKAMTAVLAGRLVEQGKLRWDTRVEEVFPDLADAWQVQGPGPTLEQLLTHRAGVVANLNWARLSREGSVGEQRIAAVREAFSTDPRHPYGTVYEYSNLGYVVVGAMLERVGGKSWEMLIGEQVFKPLGMTGVGQGGLGTPGKLDQPWGHTGAGRPVAANGPAVDNPPVLGPAGRMHASLDAWAAFIADQLRGARGKPALLKRETYQRLHQPSAGADYALGWAVTEREWGGGKVLNHAGCNTMHYAVAWLAPLKDFAVLVCCNQGDDTAAKAADAAAAALIRWHSETEPDSD